MKELDELLSNMHSASTSELLVLVREVRVRIGVLTRPVTIRVWYDGRRAEPFEFELSATMEIASHGSRAASGSALTEADAIRRAVRLLTQDYEDAVRQGNIPDDRWLATVG
jgi:hypothetical protein